MLEYSCRQCVCLEGKIELCSNLQQSLESLFSSHSANHPWLIEHWRRNLRYSVVLILLT